MFDIDISEINTETLSKLGYFHENLPDVPGKSAAEMKSFFDYIPKEVLIPKYNDLIRKLKSTWNCARFDQAYIRDGKIVCNDGNNSSGKTARYIGVDMKYTPYRGKIKFGFTDTDATDCSLLLILSNKGCNDTQYITHGSIHIGVSAVGVSIQYFDGTYTYKTDSNGNYSLDGDGVKIKNFNCKELYYHTFANKLTANKTYELSFEMVQERYVRINFPAANKNGSKKYDWYSNSSDTRYDEIWAPLAGRYIIFEHFYTNATAARGYYVAWEATAPEYMTDVKDEDGNVIHKGYLTAKKEFTTAAQAYNKDGTPIETNALTDWKDEYELCVLKHDFGNSLDGELIASPTGQVYHLFNNDV